MKNLIIYTLAIFAFSACKKDPIVEECSEEAEGTLKIHFHHMVGMQQFALNTDFTDDFGNTYQFTRADFYMRVKDFKDHDGNEITSYSKQYFLLNSGVSSKSIENIEASTLHNLGWGIGVDSAANHSDPSTYSSDNALANQNPNMHWSWNSGYIFCALEGKVDIDDNGTFDSGETFIFHVGTDALYRDATSDLHIDTSVPVEETGDTHLEIDYSKFIEGIDLSVDNSTHTGNNFTLAEKVADNFLSVVKLH